MRNEFTDTMGDDVTDLFRRLGMTVKEFIDHSIDRFSAFDVTDTTFHVFERGNIISLYYSADYNRWYAKI